MSLPIIFISGPTAIGKSEFAIKLAKKIKAEIINADSMQVYKQLKILTARPSETDKKIVPHHLYGHVSGERRYNVAEWCEEAISIIKKNDKKKILSIIVGGTGLYINSLLKGLAEVPNISEIYKEESNKKLLELGLEKFYNEVYKIDKISCKKISKNDTQRLKRIWEVYNSTGKPLSEWISNNHNFYLENFNYHILLFFPKREDIYKKVNNRFLKMINNGVIEEVKMLLNLNLNPSFPIMKAHGVPEISNYLSGKINLEECISRSQQVTRNYVKRQLTWWKSFEFNNTNIFDHFPSNFDLKSLDFLKKIN